MGRFVARPVIVEAYQFDGHVHELPEAFRLAVRRGLMGGRVEVVTGDRLSVCSYGDWIIHGPDGLFVVLKPAAFETQFAAWFAEPAVALPAPVAVLPIEPLVIPAKRSHSRKETADA